ncbi:MAG TPA: nuclear transport factor 2 family protein [Gammaproteobacteria bacterium]|nr:nuclear transport factor 2 family protein [Gammaproteobacteria bacterium]
MKNSANNRSRAWPGVWAIVLCLALASGPAARAQDVTAKTLVERAQIQDLITRYYYNFGNDNPESFPKFYADDAELILGDTHYKGRDGIAKAYKSAGQDSTIQKAYSFNVTVSNPLIVVHGNTASAQLIFTEVLIQKQGDAPRVRAQGREYATFVKVNGEWRYKTRQIKGGTQPPEGWKE